VEQTLSFDSPEGSQIVHPKALRFIFGDQTHCYPR
jgi:hypothetical protein